MYNDEHEILIEYSEMTAFNFNSKEYKEVKKDYLECKETATGIERILKNIFKQTNKAQVV